MVLGIVFAAGPELVKGVVPGKYFRFSSKENSPDRKSVAPANAAAAILRQNSRCARLCYSRLREE
jgi:hypothetical protein